MTYTDENDCVYVERRLDPEELLDDDGDGISNAFERQHFGDTTSAIPDDDDDGDGRSNYAEFVAMTDPKSARSIFQAHVEVDASGVARVSFPSHVGRRYSIFAGGQPDDFNRILVERIPGTGERMTITDQPTGSRTFYRVIVDLPSPPQGR